MTRSEKVQQAQALRAEGLLLREIAERMGSTKQTVHSWLVDPDLSKQRARRDGYRGSCVDCGAPTDGSRGPGRAPPRCDPCTRIASRIWTRENIIEAVHEFDRRYGAPPAAADWNVGHPTEEQRARFKRDGCWPAYSSITRRFGNWNAMIEAAGFQPRAAIGGTRRNGSPVAV